MLPLNDGCGRTPKSSASPPVWQSADVHLWKEGQDVVQSFHIIPCGACGGAQLFPCRLHERGAVKNHQCAVVKIVQKGGVPLWERRRFRQAGRVPEEPS